MIVWSELTVVKLCNRFCHICTEMIFLFLFAWNGKCGMWNERTALLHEGEKTDGGNTFAGISKINCISFSAGILHKGNGENVFLSQQPPVISTVMGNGFYRSVPCGPGCSGAARDMMLFAPVALASGPDGSLYVGDFNFIRRVHPDGYTRTILELKWVMAICLHETRLIISR